MDDQVADKQENNSRVVGRPFMKGVSGNPLGRPLKGQSITDCMREYLDLPDEDTGVSRKEKLVRTVINMAMRGDVSAIKLVWAYSDGLPRQTQEIATPEDRKIIIEIVKDSTLEDANKKT